jgi:bifunctional DNase/RNase
MAQVETTIDSVRFTTASPEHTIILKQKGPERYLPIWAGQSQANILAAQIQGQPSTAPGLFLANINAADSDIKCVTIHLENDTFHNEPYEVKCPIGIALTLGYKTEAPILVGRDGL